MNFLAKLAALFVSARAIKSSRQDRASSPSGPYATRPTRTPVTSRASKVGPRSDSQPSRSHPTHGAGSPQEDPNSQWGMAAAGADAADTPLDLEKGDWKQTLKRTLKEIKEDRVTLIAAGMAYYMFLAIFPAVIAIVGILGLVHAPGVAESVRETVNSTLPGGAGKVLASAFKDPSASSESASLAAALLGIAAALWSASSGFVALQSGLNVAYEIDEDRKFIGKRAVALLLVLLTLVLGGVPSPIFTFGDSTIFTVMGWVLTVIAIVVLFSAYYAIGPKKKTPGWQWVSPGGLVGAGIWIVASLAFGFYANLGSYNKTYGALAGVIVLIFWLYLSSVAILIGGELNSELERQTKAKPATS